MIKALMKTEKATQSVGEQVYYDSGDLNKDWETYKSD